MSKHTPGPWKFVHSCTIEAERPGGNEVLGELFSAGDNNKESDIDDETEANGCLIAAAPELLEALKNIENDDGSIPAAIWKLRNDAIAKAEGRT